MWHLFCEPNKLFQNFQPAAYRSDKKWNVPGIIHWSVLKGSEEEGWVVEQRWEGRSCGAIPLPEFSLPVGENHKWGFLMRRTCPPSPLLPDSLVGKGPGEEGWVISGLWEGHSCGTDTLTEVLSSRFTARWETPDQVIDLYFDYRTPLPYTEKCCTVGKFPTSLKQFATINAISGCENSAQQVTKWV